ncbi:MAG: VOC family protein [Candidatus Binatia bacterium]|nr:VOC family protein [Candidatus Binatia bacterium]
MKQRGVNRVTMAVWDLEKGKEFYTKLLGAKFEPVNDADAEAYGVRCSISWNAGIELVSPVDGRDSRIRTFLETNGEGLAGVIFAVEDVDATKQKAEAADIPVLGGLDYTQEQIDEHLQGRFTKYKEYFFGAGGSLSPGVVVGEFEEP